MRSPVVKRHTSSGSGGSSVVPLVGDWCRPYAVWGPDFMALYRCSASVTAPPPYGGSSAVAVTMAQAAGEVTLCGLEISLDPHPIRRQGVAERVRFARACQARRRGRLRQPCRDQHRLGWSRSGRGTWWPAGWARYTRTAASARRHPCGLPGRRCSFPSPAGCTASSSCGYGGATPHAAA
jgi:hypothetical protein